MLKKALKKDTWTQSMLIKMSTKKENVLSILRLKKTFQLKNPKETKI